MGPYSIFLIHIVWLVLLKGLQFYFSVFVLCFSQLEAKYKQLLLANRMNVEEEMRSLTLSDEEHSFVSKVGSHFSASCCSFLTFALNFPFELVYQIRCCNL